jgi:large subunit ribosomal protein L31
MPARGAAAVLDRVEGEVGLLVQAVAVEAVLRVGRHAEGDRRPRGQRGAQALGQQRGLGAAGAQGQDRELVAAEATDGVRRAHHGAHRLHDPAQQLVAEGVPVLVVDALEVVEVEQHDREHTAGARGAAELGGEALLEPAAVQASRQRIRARHAAQLAALEVVVARLRGAHPRGAGQRDAHEGDLGRVDAAHAEGDGEIGPDDHGADGEHRGQGIGKGREGQREEEAGGQRAVRAAVADRADAHQPDDDRAPHEEEGLAQRRAAHDGLEVQAPQDRRADDGQDVERGHHGAVRPVPGLQLVQEEPGGGDRGDGGARLHVAQAESDVRVVLCQGCRNHPPTYRQRAPSAAIQGTGVAATLDLAMKTEIHPEYVEAHVRCTCGNEFTTRSTQSEIHVEICSNCHPFYTGRQKLVDTGGRVERFKRRAAKRGARS